MRLRWIWLAALTAGAGAAPVAEAPESAVVAHLRGVIVWYRQMQEGSRWATQPADAYFWATQRTLANQVVQQAFAYAQAEAMIMAAREGPAEGSHPRTPAARGAAQGAAAAERLGDAQAGLDSANGRLQGLAPNSPERPGLAAQRDALSAEVDLLRAVQDANNRLGSLLSGNSGAGSQVLLSRIDALKRSVPEAFAAAPAAASGGGSTAVPSGLVPQMGLFFRLLRNRRELGGLASPSGPTARLADESDRLAQSLRSARDRILQEDASYGARLTGSDPGRLAEVRRDLESLSAQFKQVAAGLIALREEGIALGQSRDNLSQWRAAFDERFSEVLRRLVIRAVFIVGAIIAVTVGSEIGRRATVRYVHETRRRRQFLVIRRLATGLLVLLVLVFGLVSNFSSLATYAGLITAGIAVALQGVILCLAGYFFLIGRYGIKPGDRVTIVGVTGDVVEVGLLRFYMMELAATGVVLHPTGRLIVLPNSVLFNATPVYKQIPGTDYASHEVVMALAPGADTVEVQRKVLDAVNGVYEKYRRTLEQQHSRLSLRVDFSLEPPKPVAEVVFTDAGSELIVRYPVDLRRVEEMDQAVSRAILALLRGDTDLAKAVTGSPRIRAAIKV